MNRRNPTMANEKILVIDDDPDLVEVIRLTLKASGFQVFGATNGKEGLARVKEINPDLIILDVMMDYTTEGFQVSLKLRSPDPASEYAEHRDTPILMLTSIHDTTPLRFAPEAEYLPVDSFAEKPLEPDELLKRVEALLER